MTLFPVQPLRNEGKVLHMGGVTVGYHGRNKQHAQQQYKYECRTKS